MKDLVHDVHVVRLWRSISDRSIGALLTEKPLILGHSCEIWSRAP